MIEKFLWLSVAGACGAIGRVALYEFGMRVKVGHTSLSTLAVNMIGSFMFGVFYAYAQRKLNISEELRVIILVGFIGSFTTFSAFAFETAKMLKAEQWILAGGNVFAQVLLGIAALVIGVLLGQRL